MEKAESSAEANGLPVIRAHGRTPCAIPVPADFYPLRLLLQPSGAIVELTQPDMLLGRHSQADIRLPLPDVSRRHCRFLFGQGVWQVYDLHSLNGLFLNGELIRQTTLQQGDLLRIGGFTFAVDLSSRQTSPDESEESEGLIRRLFKTLPGFYPQPSASRRSA